MSNLDEIRAMAADLSRKNEQGRTLLLKMGCNPAGVKAMCDSRKAFLNAIQTETPPPDIQRILDQMDKEDAK